MDHWIWAVFAAGVAGFSRGFAAFGTALIYVPLMSIAFNLETAVVTLFLIDLIPSAPLVWHAVKRCERGVVVPMAAGAAALSPAGLALLVILAPEKLEFIMGLVLLAGTSALLTGSLLRFSGRPWQSLTAGAIAGLAGGMSGIFGPPAMLYLLGRETEPVTTRANAIVFLTGESLLLGIGYAVTGLITLPRLWLAVVLTPVYGAALWLGTHSFSRSNEDVYRRLVLGLLWLLAAAMAARSGWELGF